ncbi:MAG TPA: hypothetical protein VLX44_15705 [Xanthobacteraceae bacterium]|nr:hypothetical protein [Xanthobacteraceae bacterium]
MLHRFSVRPSMHGIAKTAVVVAALALTAASAARAETWDITLSSPVADLKVDVYDVNTGSYLGRDQDISGGFTARAEAKMGGGWEVDKVGTHIRWQAKLKDRCWSGQVCSTRPGVSQSLDFLRMDDSRGAGNCSIEGSSPACGN